MTETLQKQMMQLLDITARAAGFGEPKSISVIIGALISAFLSLLGVIYLILIIYGGFLWMTSAGNEERVYKAKKVLQRSTVGLIIIISAYSVTYFIISAVSGAAL